MVPLLFKILCSGGGFLVVTQREVITDGGKQIFLIFPHCLLQGLFFPVVFFKHLGALSMNFWTLVELSAEMSRLIICLHHLGW